MANHTGGIQPEVSIEDLSRENALEAKRAWRDDHDRLRRERDKADDSAATLKASYAHMQAALIAEHETEFRKAQIVPDFASVTVERQGETVATYDAAEVNLRSTEWRGQVVERIAA